MNEKIVKNYFKNDLNKVLIGIGVIVLAIGVITRSAIILLGIALIIIPIYMYPSNKVTDEDYKKIVDEYAATTKPVALAKLGIDESMIDKEFIFTLDIDRIFKHSECPLSSSFGKRKYWCDGIRLLYIFFDKEKVYCCTLSHAMRFFSDEDRAYFDVWNVNAINLKDINNIEMHTATKDDEENYLRGNVISIQPSSGSGFVFDTKDAELYVKLKKMIENKKKS